MYVFKNVFYTVIFILIDSLGYVITSPFRLFSSKNQPAYPKNILVIRLDHIGDVMASIPAFENLSKSYPHSKITLLVSGWAQDIVQNNPYINAIIRYDAPWFSRHKRRKFVFWEFVFLTMRLHKQKFDLGIDLRGDFRHIFLMFLSGVKYRVGYGITGGGFLLDKKVPYRRDAHAIEHNLDLLKALGVNIVASEPKLYRTEQEEKIVQNLLNEFGLRQQDSFVIIHAIAGYPSKNWLDARFAKLINVLSVDYGKKVILIGSKEDYDANDQINQMSGATSINAAGKTDLVSLAGLIQKADLFIGVDSGPAYIASSENRPTVILYSATNKADEWVPSGKKTIAIQKDVTCAGCQRIVCNHNKCMEMISIEDVLAAAKSILGEKLERRSQ